MVSEKLAQKALESERLRLEQFNEFVGLGIVPKEKNSEDMLVAVYVSKPVKSLSKDFQNNIPKYIDVSANGKNVPVRTRILNIGILEL